MRGEHSFICGGPGAFPECVPAPPGPWILAGLLTLVASLVSLARGPIGRPRRRLQTAVSQAHKRYKPDLSGAIERFLASGPGFHPICTAWSWCAWTAKSWKPVIRASLRVVRRCGAVHRGAGDGTGWPGCRQPARRRRIHHHRQPGEAAARYRRQWRALLGNLGAFAAGLVPRRRHVPFGECRRRFRAGCRAPTRRPGRLQGDADATADLT